MITVSFFFLAGSLIVILIWSLLMWDDTISGFSNSSLTLTSPSAAVTSSHVKARSSGLDCGEGIRTTEMRSSSSIAESIAS